MKTKNLSRRKQVVVAGEIALATILASYTPSRAQAPDPFSIFGQAATLTAQMAIQAQWENLPKAQLACIDQELRKRGQSLNSAIKALIGPGDQRITPLKKTCSVPEDTISAAQYSVDGLTLGGRIVASSSSYQDYRCTSSEQFEGWTRCTRGRQERTPNGLYRTTTSLLHNTTGNVAYINQFIEPAFFRQTEIDAQISRLSQKYGSVGKVQKFHGRDGSRSGVIVTWGALSLRELDEQSKEILAAGKSPKLGILIDYMGELNRSAQMRLPVFRIEGGPGYIWSASYDAEGRGNLRFLAIDPSKLVVQPPAVVENGTKYDVEPTVVSTTESVNVSFGSIGYDAATRKLQFCHPKCSPVSFQEMQQIAYDRTLTALREKQLIADEPFFTSSVQTRQESIKPKVTYHDEIGGSKQVQPASEEDRFSVSLTDSASSTENDRSKLNFRTSVEDVNRRVAEAKVKEAKVSEERLAKIEQESKQRAERQAQIEQAERQAEALRKEAEDKKRDAAEKERREREAPIAEASEKGPLYAQKRETTWRLKSKINEMTDKTDFTVESMQQNSGGVVAELKGFCDGSDTIFSALIIDDKGKPTISLPKDRGLFGNEGVKGQRRINELQPEDYLYPHRSFSNDLALVRISNQPPPLSPKSLPSKDWVWRVYAQIETGSGPIIVKIPLFEPSIRKVIEDCSAKPN